VIDAIRRGPRPPRIIVLSAWCNPYTVYRVERLPVQGFLDKRGATVGALRDALAAVGGGRCYFSEAYCRAKAARRADPQAFDKVLSDREQTVLTLIGDWLTDWEVAKRLGLSPSTAEKHRFNIQRKLGLRTKTELVRYASRQGIRRFVVGEP
jgi:DNA-binding NarL/FixJ family response regulator